MCNCGSCAREQEFNKSLEKVNYVKKKETEGGIVQWTNSVYIEWTRVREREEWLDSELLAWQLEWVRTTTNATTTALSLSFEISHFSLSPLWLCPFIYRLFPLVIKDHEPQLRLIQCQGLNAYALPYWCNFLSWPTHSSKITFIWNSTLCHTVKLMLSPWKLDIIL